MSKRTVLALVTGTLFVDMLLYELAVSFLPQCLREGGIGETGIGLLFGAYALGLLAATPFAGALTDRLGSRTVLAGATAALVAAMLISAFAGPLLLLLAARLLQGTAGTALWSAGLARLAAAYPAESRGRAMGTAMSGLSLGAILGPPLGGLLYEQGGRPLPFLVGAGLAALAGGLCLLMPRRPAPAPGRGFVSVLRDRRVAVTLGAVTLGGIVLSLLEPTLPLYLQSRLHAGPLTVGLFFGGATLAYGVSAPLAGFLSDRHGRRTVMLAGLIATLAILPWLTVPHTRLAEVLVLVLLGVACAFLLSPALPELAGAVEQGGEAAYGHAYALFNLAYAAGMLIGPTFGAAMAARLGLGPALLATSALAALYVPLLARRRRTA